MVLEGIPESGQERLAQNRADLYTSDLVVNEFLLVTRLSRSHKRSALLATHNRPRRRARTLAI